MGASRTSTGSCPPEATNSCPVGPALDVRIHSTGIQLIHHPVVGDLDLSFETFPLSGRSKGLYDLLIKPDVE